MNELDSYADQHRDLDATVIAAALRILTHLCVTGISDSAEEYWKLNQAEAAGHIRDLAQGLAAVNEIEKARAAGWYQATHDLTGSMSMVVMASKLLHQEEGVESNRVKYAGLLEKSVSTVQTMLSDLIDLARLDAGHELRNVEPFDVAVLLDDFCLGMQPIAEAYGLYLKSEGTRPLLVEGDAIKVQRIVQNLVLNALKYSHQGGVTVSWESRKESDGERRMVSVQDTGPGFGMDQGIPLANRFREATQHAHQVETDATAAGTSSNQDKPATTVASQSPPRHKQAGEGIGLSIVKGLCDLLEATLELETAPGQGSTLRVTFPRTYRQ